MEKTQKEAVAEKGEGEWKGQTGEDGAVFEAHSFADNCRTSYTERIARAAHTMNRAAAGPQQGRRPC